MAVAFDPIFFTLHDAPPSSFLTEMMGRLKLFTFKQMIYIFSSFAFHMSRNISKQLLLLSSS